MRFIMLSFFKKPLGCALIFLTHGLISNQIFYQFFPNQTGLSLTWPMATWTLASIYVFFTTMLLYRLLIKQGPFSKEFKKATSKYYAVALSVYTLVTFIGAKVLYASNPELVKSLFSANVINLVSSLSAQMLISVTLISLLIIVPFGYWINYFYLWLTDKIVNCFLKSKEA